MLTPGELAGRLGILPPTPEQAAVIEAPLEPMVVVAGAGSGKSETMAGRVVWLVANGLARPEQILGLTFTRKAAAELAERVRQRLAGLAAAGLVEPELLDSEPTVSTYHAYAARLVTDHALREGLEPTMRLVTPAVAWQMAARVVGQYDGPMDRVDLSPPSVTAAVLELAGELAEHLRAPNLSVKRRLRRRPVRRGPAGTSGTRRRPAGSWTTVRRRASSRTPTTSGRPCCTTRPSATGWTARAVRDGWRRPARTAGPAGWPRRIRTARTASRRR